MRWRGERQSENVEDRRDESGGFGFPLPGGGVRFPSGGGGGSGSGGGIGLIGFLILLGLALLFGVDPRVILSGGGPTGDDTNFPDIHLPQSRPGAPGGSWDASGSPTSRRSSSSAQWTSARRASGPPAGSWEALDSTTPGR